MKINEEILNKFTMNLSDDELDKYLADLLNTNEDKNEYKKLYYALKELNQNNYNLTDDYKNKVLFKVNNKLVKNRLINKINKLSYALYFVLALLIGTFFYNLDFNSDTYSKNNNKVTLSEADKALLKEIEPEVKKLMNYTELLKVEKKNVNKEKDKVVKEIKNDEELLAIVETNKYFLSENYIPAVDDLLLFECLDEELIEKIFNKL